MFPTIYKHMHTWYSKKFTLPLTIIIYPQGGTFFVQEGTLMSSLNVDYGKLMLLNRKR